MAWFHSSLEEVKLLLNKGDDFNKEDLEKVRAILKEHIRSRVIGDMKTNLNKAAGGLERYNSNLLAAYNSLVNVSDESALLAARYRGPSGDRGSRRIHYDDTLPVFINQAQFHIHEFEALMLELIKEGKFQE